MSYNVSIIGSGSYIPIILFVGLILLSIERIFAYKKGKRGKNSNIFTIGALIVATVLVGAMLFVLPSANSIKIRNGALTANFITGFTKVEISSQDVVDVKVIDWIEQKEYAPISRNLGTGIGDYKEGKYTLRNGKKALLYTNSSRVLYIETKENIIILGPDNFEEFIKDFSKNIFTIK